VLQIWGIAKEQILYTFKGHTRTIYSLAFSLGGSLIVSGSEDGTTRIWDMTHGSSNTLAITNHPGKGDVPVFSAAISPDGRMVAAGSSDGVRRPYCLLDV
jgi:WD40 repeat protein